MVVVDPLQTDASWLQMSREEEEVVDSIQILASNLSQDVKCKISLLYKIMDLCINTAFFGSSQRLIDFCRRYDLVERIQVLLEDEPWYQLSTELRQVAMLTIEILRSVSDQLKNHCHHSLTCLQTLRNMDSMLRAIVLSSSPSRISEELQNILQVLLDFTNSRIEEVWSRALGRIEVLSRFLYNYSTQKPFERYLTPSERTHIILAAMEVMTETTVFDKMVAQHILEVAMRDPDFWLIDVQKILTCIYDSVQGIQKLAIQHCFDSLLMKMADEYPEEVVTTLLNIAPQGDSTALQLWGQIFYKPQIREKILMVFVSLLRFLQMTNIPSTTEEGTCIPDLPPSSRQFPSKDLGDKPDAESNQRHPRLVTASLLVGGLHMLSETHDMARKMQVLLPHMMGVLQVGSADLKIKVLMFFKNVMGKTTTFQNLDESVGSPITGQLMENLRLLFDSECSQLRELSICLFRDQLEPVVGSNQKRNSDIRSVLIPLLFRMSDQSPGVAKASGEALLSAAKLLKWKELKQLLETQQTCRIGKCLLMKDKSRAEEYLHQSLPYLRDPQATVREVAVRFIALQSLQTDSDPSVSSLAVQTACILKSPRVQRKQGFILRALCRWCPGPEG
ncbi:bone morphogenetic protein 6 [Turdus rufiventris]|nr:bone morphogenetic protein 6 [Turdus rufiventris]